MQLPKNKSVSGYIATFLAIGTLLTVKCSDDTSVGSSGKELIWWEPQRFAVAMGHGTDDRYDLPTYADNYIFANRDSIDKYNIKTDKDYIIASFHREGEFSTPDLPTRNYSYMHARFNVDNVSPFVNALAEEPIRISELVLHGHHFTINDDNEFNGDGIRDLYVTQIRNSDGAIVNTQKFISTRIWPPIRD